MTHSTLLHPSAFCALTLAALVSAEAAKPTLDQRTLAVTAGDYHVEFRVDAGYSLGRTTFRGNPLILTTGANQTVLNVKREIQSGPDQWIGTAHGGEEVVSAHLEVDGQSYPIEVGMEAPEGKRYTVRKVSRLGPIEMTAATSVSKDGIDQTVTFQSIGTDPEVRYLYVFMHCFNPTFHQWLAVKADDEVTSERFPDERVNSLKLPVKRLGFYDEATKIGVALVYPEAYEGDAGIHNMLINWPGRHYKHYLRLNAAQAIGHEFRCRLVAFPAEADQWQAKVAEVAVP